MFFFSFLSLFLQYLLSIISIPTGFFSPRNEDYILSRVFELLCSHLDVDQYICTYLHCEYMEYYFYLKYYFFLTQFTWFWCTFLNLSTCNKKKIWNFIWVIFIFHFVVHHVHNVHLIICKRYKLMISLKANNENKKWNLNGEIMPDLALLHFPPVELRFSSLSISSPQLQRITDLTVSTGTSSRL